MANTLVIRCQSCGAKNRIPQEKLAGSLAPLCGRCKVRLPVDVPVTVTDATFAAEVEQSSVPVVVDMWAPWCGPCRMIAPMIDELASEWPDGSASPRSTSMRTPQPRRGSMSAAFQHC